MNHVTFEYLGFDHSGKRLQGTLQAATRNDAFRALVAQGLTPTRLIPARHAAPARAHSHTSTLDPYALSDLTRALGALLQAHLPIAQALKLVARQHHPAIQPLALDLARRVEAGESLAAAIEAHKPTFGPAYLELARAAERSGKLPALLAHLADTLDKSHDTDRALRGALLRPALVLAALGVIIAALAPLLGPDLASLLAQHHHQSPLTRWLSSLGQHAHDAWWRAPLVGALALALGLFTWRHPRARTWLGAILGRTPLVGSALAAAAHVRFLRFLGLSLTSGLSLVESLALAGDASGRPDFAAGAATLARKLNAGATLSETLESAAWLPDYTRATLASTQDARSLPLACEHLAHHYQRHTDRRARQLTALLYPALLLPAALLLLAFALTLALPA